MALLNAIRAVYATYLLPGVAAGHDLEEVDQQHQGLRGAPASRELQYGQNSQQDSQALNGSGYGLMEVRCRTWSAQSLPFRTCSGNPNAWMYGGDLSVPQGQSCTAGCSAGETLIGDATVTCTNTPGVMYENTPWQLTTPVSFSAFPRCEPSAPGPRQLQQYSQQHSQNLNGSNYGFEVRCRTWGQLPIEFVECIENDNAWLFHQDLSVPEGESCTAVCPAGTRLEGNATITCESEPQTQQNGPFQTMSPVRFSPFPSCVPINQRELQPAAPRKAQQNSQQHSQNLNGSGYGMEVRCRTWGPQGVEFESCEGNPRAWMYWGDLSLPAGEECTAVCPAGTQLNGDAVIRCTETPSVVDPNSPFQFVTPVSFSPFPTCDPIQTGGPFDRILTSVLDMLT